MRRCKLGATKPVPVSDSPVVGLLQVLSGEHGENKPCSVNAASWFPSVKSSPIWTAGQGDPQNPPPARRGFTVADQVNQLVTASEEDPDLGFMARMMALCSLPRTNPGNRKEYVRRNGPYTLVMTSGFNNKLPFGTCPGCCWPGSRPKRYGPKAASWF